MKDKDGGPVDLNVGLVNISEKKRLNNGVIKVSMGNTVVNCKDFTSDRKYFNPRLPYYDSEYVIYTVTNTLAEGSAAALQCLNAKTAELDWTVQMPYEYADNLVRYKDGFMINDNTFSLVINYAGKIVSKNKN